MSMIGLPDMYTRSPRAAGLEGVNIRQTTNAHGITVMYHIAPPLANWNYLKPGSMQVSNLILFIGNVVGIDCVFSLTEKFQCITFIVKDTHFECGFWYHFALQVS